MSIINHIDNETSRNSKDISSYSIFSRGDELKVSIWFRGESYRYGKYVVIVDTDIQNKINMMSELEYTIKENNMKIKEAKELKKKIKKVEKILKTGSEE